MGRAFGTMARARAPPSWRSPPTAPRPTRWARASPVTYGDTLTGDLTRRDFTVNAMALRLPDLELVDPCGGLSDLASGVLRTP